MNDKVDIKTALAAITAKHKVLANNVPLAIGVLAALQAAHTEYSKRTVRRAIGMHCNRLAYHKAIAAGGARYALDESISGEINDLQIAHANRQIKRQSKTKTFVESGQSCDYDAKPKRPMLKLKQSA